jgi:hypothetical protein
VIGVLWVVVLCASLDLLRTGLTFGLFCVWARGRIVLFGATDFFAVVIAAGVFSGVMDGVTLPVPVAARRIAYGSAVAGRGSSGRRLGRRTIPPINEPVPVEFFRADLVASPDIAEGGRAGPEEAVDTLDAVLALRDLTECDLAGEYAAAAEFGRSGTPLEATNLALRCSAIFSFKALRAAPVPTDFENEATLFCDEDSEAFGLFGSFSSAVFSRFSSVSNILSALSASSLSAVT